MEEQLPIEPVQEVSPELQAAVDSALTKIHDRSFSGRHPELGKMAKCQVCGLRHRVNERKCEQVFTYRVGDFEIFREEENEETKEIKLVPDYRTAVRPDEKPTKGQIIGRAAFAKKRFHPHLSKFNLLFVERTRVIYNQLKFVWNFLGTPAATASKLSRARVIAKRQLHKEREFREREIRRRQDLSRRINRGLL